MEITHEKMRQVYEIIDLPKIIESMRARYVALHSMVSARDTDALRSLPFYRYNTEFEPPVSVLFSEQSTFIKEQLDFCLDTIADLVRLSMWAVVYRTP